jgi:lysophospholipase L1-like esterase
MPQERKFRPSVKIAAVLLVTISLGVFLEGAARVIYAFRDEIVLSSLFSGFLQRSLDLDPYEMPSPQGGHHWVLRPGYRSSLTQLLLDKKALGRDVGLRSLNTFLIKKNAYTKDIFQVNKNGFKGSELDPTHRLPRILILGDSITFGLANIDYPNYLGMRLREKGINAEVINGGVEGYTSRNHLLEIGRYKSLEPEFAILYIGWNELFTRVPWPEAWENRLRIVWLLKQSGKGLRLLVGNSKSTASKLYNRALHPVPDSEDVVRLETYVPPFPGRIGQIIDEFKSIGTKVILVTLPSLFTMHETPDLEKMKAGYLPDYTKNPFVLAKLGERYNVALKSLALEKKVDLMDLEQWSTESLKPRERYFLDSIHFTLWGLKRVGVYMADWIAGHLKTLRKNSSDSTL